ncbi:hypothetical protein HPB50_021487 [Hyalomma asiaticum]|uniref:Uncharacterized protein n=1 Tax=Hyalomma asiaticum TaxID=266040 RepID=A0ACB7SHT0_HYAAI|nr:hypothetical protein HPB50_021487 [Hyalomma asiaticum]
MCDLSELSAVLLLESLSCDETDDILLLQSEPQLRHNLQQQLRERARLSSPLATGAGGAGGVAESEWRGGARSGVCEYDAAACARAVATRRAGGVDVCVPQGYLPFSEELRQQRQSSLLVLDRHVCPSVGGGLCDDGANDAVNENYFARSGKDGEYCGVNLVANVYGNLISHAVATSPVRDTSPYKDLYTLAYTGDGVFVVAGYLAPNLARDAVAAQLDAGMESVCARSKVSDPVVLVGDFNVDVRKKSGEWLVEYMRTKYSTQCAPAESDKCPTTIHGSCIDLAFTRNCDVRMLYKDPLTVHFSDHKAVIMAVRYNDNKNRCR